MQDLHDINRYAYKQNYILIYEDGAGWLWLLLVHRQCCWYIVAGAASCRASITGELEMDAKRLSDAAAHSRWNYMPLHVRQSWSNAYTHERKCLSLCSLPYMYTYKKLYTCMSLYVHTHMNVHSERVCMYIHYIRIIPITIMMMIIDVGVVVAWLADCTFLLGQLCICALHYRPRFCWYCSSCLSFWWVEMDTSEKRLLCISGCPTTTSI